MIEARFDTDIKTVFFRYRRKIWRKETFCVVNPDYEQVWGEDFDFITKVSRPTRNKAPYNIPGGPALPATARFIDDTPVTFTCPLQAWIHALCCERIPNTSEMDKKNFFNSLWRGNAFMTNYAGTDSRKNCINGDNPLEDYPQIQPMVTGGALLRVAGEVVKDNGEYWLVEAINPEEEFEAYHPGTHAWLFFEPTLSARKPIVDKKKGLIGYEEWYQEPFHHYEEKTVIPVLGFIEDKRSSTGWCNLIEKQRVRVLKHDEFVPSPYILRDGRVLDNPYEKL